MRAQISNRGAQINHKLGSDRPPCHNPLISNVVLTLRGAQISHRGAQISHTWARISRRWGSDQQSGVAHINTRGAQIRHMSTEPRFGISPAPSRVHRPAGPVPRATRHGFRSTSMMILRLTTARQYRCGDSVDCVQCLETMAHAVIVQHELQIRIGHARVSVRV